jgi:hypothetical protein
MRKSLLLLIFSFGFLWAAGTQAQVVRALPEKAERGTLGENQPFPQVTIGGEMLRLAPGATIYDQQNRSVVQGQLPANADILFTKDQNGDVLRIYILTEQEKVRLDQAPRR